MRVVAVTYRREPYAEDLLARIGCHRVIRHKSRPLSEVQRSLELDQLLLCVSPFDVDEADHRVGKLITDALYGAPPNQIYFLMLSPRRLKSAEVSVAGSFAEHFRIKHPR